MGAAADTSMIDLAEMIFFHANSNPNKPAVITGEAILTYGMLRQGILSVQQRLEQNGIKVGNYVVICVTNTSAIAHITLICALYRAGMTSVSLDPNQMEFLDDLVVDALLTDGPVAPAPVKTIVLDNSWFEDKTVAFSAPNVAITHDVSSDCRLILSSGTTGRPKIIGLSFAAVRERLLSYSIRTSSPSWDRLVCMPGLSTNYGFSFAITALWLGRTVCFAFDVNARQLIVAHQADLLVASTHQISSMVQYQEATYVRMDSLRGVHIGGAIAYAPLLARIRLMVCSNVVCGYGSTEGGTVAYAPAEAIFGMDRAVGITVPWAELEILDDQNNTVSFGQQGQLRLRSLGQGYRYKKASSKTYEIDRSEWFYPGDQALHHRNGLLIITGRINELINRGGVKVAPDQIEEEFKKNPAISDAAAIGVLDSIGIEQIWLAAVSRDGGELDIKKLYDYCREHLSSCIPDRIFQVTEIPRNQLGKVSRVPLTEKLKTLESSMALTIR
ncbi:MAG: class I adenylate-forming enzyme family protein [Burkholderiaceae bacterium]